MRKCIWRDWPFLSYLYAHRHCMSWLPVLFCYTIKLSFYFHKEPCLPTTSQLLLPGVLSRYSEIRDSVLCIWTTLYKKKRFVVAFMLSFPLVSAFSLLSVFWKLSPLHFISPFLSFRSWGLQCRKTPLLVPVVLSARVPLVPVTAITRKVLSSYFSLRGSTHHTVLLKQSAFKGQGCVYKVVTNTDPAFSREPIIQCIPE